MRYVAPLASDRRRRADHAVVPCDLFLAICPQIAWVRPGCGRCVLDRRHQWGHREDHESGAHSWAEYAAGKGTYAASRLSDVQAVNAGD